MVRIRARCTLSLLLVAAVSACGDAARPSDADVETDVLAPDDASVEDDGRPGDDGEDSLDRGDAVDVDGESDTADAADALDPGADADGEVEAEADGESPEAETEADLDEVPDEEADAADVEEVEEVPEDVEDGFADGDDVVDGPSCVPTGPEVCDDLDNDCDGATDEEAGCVCRVDPDCDDGNPCTADTCTAERHCIATAVSDGSSCGPGLCCGGACIDPVADDDNCGGCGLSCGRSAVCTGGGCTCTPPALDCDGSRDSGCEVDPDSSPFDCGACGRFCDEAGLACAGGVCGCATQEWNVDVVDTKVGVGADASLAHDAGGNLHLVYYDEIDGDLRYAHHPPSGFWSQWSPSSRADWPVEELAIALDPAGWPHLIYNDPVRGATHAWRGTTGWRTEAAPSGFAGRPTAVIDARGTLYLVYSAADGLHCSIRDAAVGAWADEIIDPGPWTDLFPAAALDDEGGLHVAYTIYGPPVELRYAVRSGSGLWLREAVEGVPSVPLSVTMAVTEEGGSRWINVLFGMRLARRMVGTSGWALEDVASGGAYIGALAAAPDATLRAAFCDDAARQVRFARRSATGVWTSEIIGSSGFWVRCSRGTIAAAVDEAGGVHVLAPGSTDGDVPERRDANVYYYQPPGRAWQSEFLYDSVFVRGELPVPGTLVVHGAEQVHVTTDGRHFRRPVGELWQASVVDWAGTVGQYASLAVTTDDVVHATYYDATNGDLKHARLPAGGSWEFETVDSIGDVGRHTSCAAGDAGDLHVTYYDATNTALRYAVRSGATGAWTLSVVEQTPGFDLGLHSALDVAPDGTVHVVYADVTDNRLRYARLDPAATIWAFENLGCGCGDEWAGAAVAVDSAGGVHVVFGPAPGTEYDYRASATSPWVGSWLATRGSPACWSTTPGYDRALRRSMQIDELGGVHVAAPATLSGYRVLYETLPAGGGTWTSRYLGTGDVPPIFTSLSPGLGVVDIAAGACCSGSSSCGWSNFLVHLRNCR